MLVAVGGQNGRHGRLLGGAEKIGAPGHLALTSTEEQTSQKYIMFDV